MTSLNAFVSELKKNDKSPDFYQYYPRLFKAYFPNIENNVVDELSLVGYSYYHSILILDELLDDKIVDNVSKMIFLQEESIKKLSFLYNKKSDFWRFWEQRKAEYFEAYKVEKKINNSNITWNLYVDLADKKSAIGKIAIDSLFVFSDEETQVYNSLLESHKYFSIGFQLYDDVTDFKMDLQKKQFNWAVYELLKQVDDFENVDYNILHKLLFIRGVGQEILNLSIFYFQKAVEVLSFYNIQSEWVSVICENIKIIKNYINETNGYLSCVIKKIEIGNEANNVNFIKYSVSNKMVNDGLDYINKSYSNSYSELKHIMYLSESFDGFSNEAEIHCTDTFPRMILDECIFDISNKYSIDCNDYVNNEMGYILNLRNKDDLGGWSYFPTVKEIAPDIDDLGQFIQLFIKFDKIGIIRKYCDHLIEISLNNKLNKDGGISTWIIPNINRNDIQRKQILFNETKWGNGPDVEVVANFIYSLHLYDSLKYKKEIENAIEYIVNVQNDNKYWTSRWYYGNYYGTYVCLRLLNLYKNDKTIEAIDGCKRYLVFSQNIDGGYGLDEHSTSDMLSSAYALMCLKFYPVEFLQNICKVEEFLKSNQKEEGYWEATEFIKPKSGKSYKSRTLTTAIVLKSLIQ